MYKSFGFLLGTGMTIFCAYSILIGRMTYGSMSALLSLFRQFRSSAKSVIDVIPSSLSLFVNVERLVNLEDLESTLTEPLKSDEEIREFYENELEEIGLKDVRFSYPTWVREGEEEIRGEKQDKVVLSDMNIALKKGQFTSITGVSGYGKSTVMKVLLGLYHPDEGLRYMKTRSGGVEELPMTYQKLFAYVPPGNMLMRGTIREAIAFGIPKFFDDDEGLWEAPRLACADEFVREYPDGLDAELGELGAGLSEGQTQRLSLARAIYSKHPIIMLDESTSALDPKTEEKLLTNLKGLENRTLVIITHRQSVVDVCDQNIHFGQEGL